MKLIVLVALVVVTSSAICEACPTFSFKCPTGEGFSVKTCWKWSKFSCKPCRSVISEMGRQCRKYSCGGSVKNWYARNVGCTSPLKLTRAMTNVFSGACGILDICYSTPGRKARQCELDFRSNMLKTCKLPGWGLIAYPICASTAAIAYEVVRAHGHTFPKFAATCRRA